MREIKQIGIIGAGAMGSGIAEVAARAGYTAVLQDIIPNAAQKAIERIGKRLKKQVEKGKLEAEECGKILARISAVETLEEIAKSDLVVEAAAEKVELKKELFSELDKLADPDVILATNTSSISITEIAAATGRPDLVVGMHFFNPAPVMKLLEVVRGIRTSQETIDTILSIGEVMGKITIVAQDKAGFIVNRILGPTMNEAILVLEEGIGTAEDIDKGMKYGCNYPLGPLALADMVGLDIVLATLETLHKEFGGSKYSPRPLLKKMVAAGKLGVKTGEGFYKYE